MLDAGSLKLEAGCLVADLPRLDRRGAPSLPADLLWHLRRRKGRRERVERDEGEGEEEETKEE